MCMKYRSVAGIEAIHLDIVTPAVVLVRRYTRAWLSMTKVKHIRRSPQSDCIVADLKNADSGKARAMACGQQG